jgi:hypothetical protein
MPRTPFSIAALIGFALASASTLLAIFLFSYGFASGGFPPHDPLLLVSSRIGVALAAAGALCVLVSLRQPNRLRWLCLAWALAALIGWFAVGFGKQ